LKNRRGKSDLLLSSKILPNTSRRQRWHQAGLRQKDLLRWIDVCGSYRTSGMTLKGTSVSLYNPVMIAIFKYKLEQLGKFKNSSSILSRVFFSHFLVSHKYTVVFVHVVQLKLSTQMIKSN
jgi:hypothetical protein